MAVCPRELYKGGVGTKNGGGRGDGGVTEALLSSDPKSPPRYHHECLFRHWSQIHFFGCVWQQHLPRCSTGTSRVWDIGSYSACADRQNEGGCAQGLALPKEASIKVSCATARTVYLLCTVPRIRHVLYFEHDAVTQGNSCAEGHRVLPTVLVPLRR